MHDWTNYVDQGKSVDVIYIDFMKAFNKVSHKHLIRKLKNFEIHEQLIKLCCSSMCAVLLYCELCSFVPYCFPRFPKSQISQLCGSSTQRFNL